MEDLLNETADCLRKYRKDGPELLLLIADLLKPPPALSLDEDLLEADALLVKDQHLRHLSPLLALAQQLARLLPVTTDPPSREDLDSRARLLLVFGRFRQTALSEVFTTPEARQQAATVSSSLLLTPPSIRLPILRHVLSVFLPLLFKPHPKLNPLTGRVLSRPLGGERGTQDWYEDSEDDGTGWRRQAGLGGVVQVVIEGLKPGEVEDLWPLLLPPLLSYLDDYETKNKVVGTEILASLLDRVDASLLRRTGVGKVFEKSLESCFSTVSDPLAPTLLSSTYPVALKLLDLQYPPSPIAATPSASLSDEPRFTALCTLLTSSTLHTWEFKSSHVALETVTALHLPPILDALGAGTIRYLQILVPHLSDLLAQTATAAGGTWTEETVEMMRLAAVALESVVRNGRARMGRWEGRVGGAVAQAWVGLRESERAQKMKEAEGGRSALDGLENALRGVVEALEQAVGGEKIAERLRVAGPVGPPAPPDGTSTSGYHAAYAVPAPAPPPPGPVNIDDLDPFSPRTLGSTVTKGSRLEVIDNSGSESGSPTQEKAFAGEQERGKKQAAQTALGHKREGSGSFFGNMLRSISGTPSKEQQQQRDDHPPPPVPPLPLPGDASPTNSRPSTPPPSSSHSSAPAAPQTPTGPSTLAKPFTSIASVFSRSTPKPSPASTASSTPQPGSSPGTHEKGAFMKAIAGAGGKGKEKERVFSGGPGEKAGAEEYDEKRGGKEGDAGGKGKEKEKDEPVFDFNRFLEQMRTRSADPIAKYLRSFLKEFSRRPPVSTTDQTRVINDFLDFIAGKMRSCDPWKSIVEVEWRHDPERGEAEFDMAMEAMEKLVMNRLWHLTFTPALDLSTFPGHMSPSGDVERDHVLSQRIRLFQWIEPKHLDLPIPSSSSASTSLSSSTSSSSAPASPNVPQGEAEDSTAAPSADGDSVPASAAAPASPVAEGKKPAEGEKASASGSKSGRKQVQGFLEFAQRELCKMNQYKAPRDKLICVLNCCKVIFGLMRHVATGEEGADTFIPFLIFVVLKANPENLVSNLQYIQRFRNPEKLSGEGGYYLSSLNAAISFIESLDASSLSNITQSEFEHFVAAAVKKLAAEEPPPPVPPLDRRPSAFDAASQTSRPTSPTSAPARFPSPSHDPTQPPLAASEAESASASLVLPTGEGASTPTSFPESTKQFLLRGTDSVEKAMSKPLGALAKIFEQLEQTANEITGQPQHPGQYGGQQIPPRGIPPAPLPPSPTPSLGFASGGAPPPPSSVAGQRPNAHKRRSYLAPARPGLPPLPPSTGSLHLRSPPSPDPAMYVAEDVGDEDVMREIDRQHEEQRMAAIGTLQSVFPGMEREVLEMVLLSSANDVGKAIDSLLEMA
ncbi:hypothetical protein JCM6882_002061 [Rhodosporidiobolus microsporus]